MAKIVTSGQIHIYANHKVVFDYFSNLEHDRFWRKEIISTTMTGKPHVGVLATEDSFLSKEHPAMY